MKESTRTLVFVVVAGASVSLATLTHYVSKPTLLEGFEQVGQQFYPDFTDPNEAQSLRVIGFSEDTASVREFNVEFKDGAWRIPSHHSYPADAKDRLSETAASVIGITRDGLASRRKSDFKRYGVIDPLSDDMTALTGRGQRISLTKADGTILADYVIGKKVEGQEDQYYVRRPNGPDEDVTYRAKLKIDLSTKFADWIEPDLLKVDSSNITEVVVNKYSVDEARGALVGQEVTKLDREKSADPWKLEGIDETAEELNNDVIREMVTQLDNLKIVGVRPKPKGINADLSVDTGVARNPLLFATLRSDMRDKGFLLFQDKKGDPVLISNEGEMQVATNKGVVYDLHFGEIFSGSDEEIEVGFASNDKKDDDKKGDDNSNKDGDADKKDKDVSESPNEVQDDEKKENDEGDDQEDEKPKDDLKSSRYLYVTARFNAQYIGKEPVKPEEPAKPEATETSTRSAEEETKSTSEESKPDALNNDGEKPAEKPADEEKPSEKPVDAKKPTEKPTDEEKKDADAEYKKALEEYNKKLKEYEEAVEKRNEKIADGEKDVEDLNRRFGEWYYVISDDSFQNLRISRQDLVKPKENPADSEKEKTEDKTEDKPEDTKAP